MSGFIVQCVDSLTRQLSKSLRARKIRYVELGKEKKQGQSICKLKLNIKDVYIFIENSATVVVKSTKKRQMINIILYET